MNDGLTFSESAARQIQRATQQVVRDYRLPQPPVQTQPQTVSPLWQWINVLGSSLMTSGLTSGSQALPGGTVVSGWIHYGNGLGEPTASQSGACWIKAINNGLPCSGFNYAQCAGFVTSGQVSGNPNTLMAFLCSNPLANPPTQAVGAMFDAQCLSPNSGTYSGQNIATACRVYFNVPQSWIVTNSGTIAALNTGTSPTPCYSGAM